MTRRKAKYLQSHLPTHPYRREMIALGRVLFAIAMYSVLIYHATAC